MKKKSKEIIGLPVISITDGVQIGAVGGLLVNPQNKSVEILLLDEKEEEKLEGIAFLSAEGIGEFAVTVENKKVLINLPEVGLLKELMEKDIAVIGTKVITKKGKYLGDVSEYALDTGRGTLEEFFYRSEEGVEKSVGVQSVITIGKEVLVVEEEEPADVSNQGDSMEKVRPKPGQALREPEKVRPEPEQARQARPEPEQVKFKSEDKPVEGSNALKEDTGHPWNEAVFVADEQKKLTDALRNDKEVVTAEENEQLGTAGIFVRHQRQYLVGKTLLKDIKSDENEIIARENEVVSEEIYQRISEMGTQKLMELAVSVKD